MKKSVLLTGLVLGIFVLTGLAVPHAAAAEISEVFEPVNDDGSNFEDTTAEIDSEAEARASEAPPEDQAPAVAGVGVEI